VKLSEFLIRSAEMRPNSGFWGDFLLSVQLPIVDSGYLVYLFFLGGSGKNRCNGTASRNDHHRRS